MSARAIGSGTISFGLVSIPVKLYSAAQPSSSISFNLLHKKCASRLKQQYFCPQDGEKVEREEMIKGYEFSKGQYVTLTEEELKELEEKATGAIEITEFVPEEKVDPIYFDKPYYLGPDKGGERAYLLLAEVMRQAGRVALAKYAARGKGYLVMIRPAEKGLVMQQLHYADEIRPFSEVPLGEAELKEPEVKLALQLVAQVASDTFRPEAYEDEVRKRIHGLIQRKVEGQEIASAPEEAPKAQIIDLMEALKASLARKGESTAEAPSPAEERKPAKRSPRQPAKARADKAPKG
jgi:DNA end-binding protein Ku